MYKLQSRRVKKKWKKSKAASSISQATPKLQNKRGNTQKPKTRTKEAEEQQPQRPKQSSVQYTMYKNPSFLSIRQKKKKKRKRRKKTADSSSIVKLLELFFKIEI